VADADAVFRSISDAVAGSASDASRPAASACDSNAWFSEFVACCASSDDLPLSLIACVSASCDCLTCSVALS
jgi:hypothetical protein